MERSTNAMTELAEDIRVMSLWVDSKYQNILDKTRRIVAELAKVDDVNDVYRLQLVKRPNQGQAIAAIVTCRAIAEEGVKDGQ